MSLPKCVDTDDLARVLGIDERTVRRLVKKGILKRDKLGFDLADSIVSYIAYREGLATNAAGTGDFGVARAAVYKERAAKMKLEREALEGSLLPANEVRATWSQAFVLARTRMLAIPSKLAGRMALLNKPGDCAKLMDAEIREGLEDIAGTEVIANGQPI
jgi:phage terminase Nu1 subunit (DNA packaging protein)